MCFRNFRVAMPFSAVSALLPAANSGRFRRCSSRDERLPEEDEGAEGRQEVEEERSLRRPVQLRPEVRGEGGAGQVCGRAFPLHMALHGTAITNDTPEIFYLP